MVNDDVDGFGVEALQEVRFPVVLSPWGKSIIHHPLHLDIRHGTNRVRKRRADLPERLEDAFTFFDGTVVTNEDGHDALPFGRGHEGHEGTQLVRARAGKVVIEPDDL